MKAPFLSFISIVCFLSYSYGQQVSDIVPTEGIPTTLQKNNIGKLFFTEMAISTSEAKETDFLKTYRLTNKSDLYFMAFFDNSLTNYMHKLAPELAADSLVQLGNYQFSILIDDQLIYASNLHPGAPRANTQDSATSINKPLINNGKSFGLWSESFWNRFLYNGGDSVLTDGKHLLKMVIRPYIQTNTLKVGEIIAQGELQLDVLRHATIDATHVKLNPIQSYTDIPVSKDKFDHQKIKELKATIDEGVFKKINGIVVLRNGKLLIEEYFNGETRNSLHDPRSVGKSFASSLMGMAIRDGYIKNTDQPLKEFYNLADYANPSNLKENTTIQKLLTMSSSFDGDDSDYDSPGNEENMYPSADWVKFTLDLPMKPTDPPGEWHYFTAGVILLGDILNQHVTGGLKEYAYENLFKPLHITQYEWQFTPQNVPNTAGGIQMNALDFAKYGQLYQNKGVWNGIQIIPADWIAESFSKQKPIGGRNNEYYGYLFWNKTYEVNGKAVEAYYCAGNGGNYILIFKDAPLVVVVTASAYGLPYAHPQVNKMLVDYILPAVLPQN